MIRFVLAALVFPASLLAQMAPCAAKTYDENHYSVDAVIVTLSVDPSEEDFEIERIELEHNVLENEEDYVVEPGPGLNQFVLTFINGHDLDLNEELKVCANGDFESFEIVDITKGGFPE